jgi:hypothetical protein
LLHISFEDLLFQTNKGRGSQKTHLYIHPAVMAGQYYIFANFGKIAVSAQADIYYWSSYPLKQVINN